MKETAFYWAISDGWAMFQRNWKHIFRNPESIIISIALPVILMLMFVYVFGGAIETNAAYVNYVVPGIIITCLGYGSSTTAMGITQDMTEGLFTRLRSMPVHPSSMLVGHVAGSLAKNLISTVIVIVVAFLIGFRPNAGFTDWIAAFGLLLLFMLSLCWIAVVCGLLANNIEVASAFTFLPMFLPYVSSAFVPTDTMPKWLQAFSDSQPMTPLIESLRGLLIGTPIGNNVILSIIWFGSMLIIAFVAAIVIFKQKSVH